MVHPDTSSFWVSWQDDELLDSDAVTGAESAITWARERADVVFIRLGHTAETYFSAGNEHPDRKLPIWPPSQPPPEGWFTPSPSDHHYRPRKDRSS